jgi:asparagine synthase (glutamine-hydrolysing)
MPGICGIIGGMHRQRNEMDLKLMIDCMNYEPFYGSVTHVNEQLGLYAGWVGHKGSFSDCMPIMNEKKDLILIFYGENFVDRGLFDQLKGRNHKFERHNASYLIHMYEEKEEDFLRELNGWFNGVLIDNRKGKGILFNDRFGMQRTYYYETEDAFYFSSEAKSLLRVIPESRQIDMRGLGEFFCCDCALENRTLYKNIFLLPGGSVWSFRQGQSVTKGHYFSLDVWENQTLLEKEFFYEKLNHTITKILPRYFNSAQPIGMSLTGGLDTRIIMALEEPQHSTLPCYSFGSMYRESFDVRIARKVAELCHQPYQVIQVGDEFLAQFPSHAARTIYISDGTLGVGETAELYVNKLARNIAPIRMTGDYGSEVLRGSRFLRANPPNKSLFQADFTEHVKNAINTCQKLEHENPLSFALFKDAPWLGYGRLSIEQSQVTLRTPYMDNDLVALMYRALPEVRASKEVSLRLIQDGNSALSTIMTDRGVGGNSNYFFRKIARSYYEFLFKAEYAYNYGMPQWLARVDHTFAPLHLERLFLGRHKFHHFRIWYRDELSDYVRDILLDRSTLSRSYLNKGFIEKMVHNHTKGYNNYTTEITKIMTIELIQRLLIENF